MDDLETRIRNHAFQLWQKHGCPEGRAEEFWLRAERIELGLMPPAETQTPHDPAKIAGF